MLKVEKKSCSAACEGFRTYLHEEKKKKGAKKTKKKNRLNNQKRFWIRKLRKLKVRLTI